MLKTFSRKGLALAGAQRQQELKAPVAMDVDKENQQVSTNKNAATRTKRNRGQNVDIEEPTAKRQKPNPVPSGPITPVTQLKTHKVMSPGLVSYLAAKRAEFDEVDKYELAAPISDIKIGTTQKIQPKKMILWQKLVEPIVKNRPVRTSFVPSNMLSFYSDGADGAPEVVDMPASIDSAVVEPSESLGSTLLEAMPLTTSEEFDTAPPPVPLNIDSAEPAAIVPALLDPISPVGRSMSQPSQASSRMSATADMLFAHFVQPEQGFYTLASPPAVTSSALTTPVASPPSPTQMRAEATPSSRRETNGGITEFLFNNFVQPSSAKTLETPQRPASTSTAPTAATTISTKKELVASVAVALTNAMETQKGASKSKNASKSRRKPAQSSATTQPVPAPASRSTTRKPAQSSTSAPKAAPKAPKAAPAPVAPLTPVSKALRSNPPPNLPAHVLNEYIQYRTEMRGIGETPQNLEDFASMF